MIPDVGGSYKVMASQLTSEGYLDNLTDPQDKTATCNSNSYIIVKRNSDVDFNMDLDYKVCLICSKYNSRFTIVSPHDIIIYLFYYSVNFVF